MALEHPSFPGYYGLALPAETLRRLEAVADAFVPGGEGYPPAREAEVARFVSEHVNADELAFFERLLGDDPGEPAEWVARLEQESPDDFAALRGWIYKAYYCSGATLQALRRRGCDYHGAPQPFGYAIGPYEQVPASPRGSFLATDEVGRAER